MCSKKLLGGGTKCTVLYPKDKNGKHVTMWSLIEYEKMPPTRLMRYCCRVLKETSVPNRLCCTGVRAAESSNRQGRDFFGTRAKKKADAHYFSLEHTKEVFEESKDHDPIWDCTLIVNMRQHNDIIVVPIYEWTDTDIWEYIHKNGLTTNPLYDKGYKRVGCIGCPMATYRETQKQFNDFPKYKQAYIRAFDRMLKLRKDSRWSSGQEVFDWWTERWKHEVKGQMDLEDWMKESEK